MGKCGDISDDRTSGAALFVVLMFAVVIANLALIALRSASSENRAAAVFVDVARTTELGRATVALTRYYISGDPDMRTRGGSFTTAFTSGTVKIDYLSESARVDVNRAPLDLLESVLSMAGLSQSRVDSVASDVIQRRSSRQTNLYASPFEIADDWNLSDDEADRIVPLLTTANSGGTVDPLLAGTPVLSVLFGGSEDRVAQFREKRMMGFPDEDAVLSYFSEPVKKWIKIGAHGSVRALAQVTSTRGLRRRFEAVFDAQEGNDAKIYYWRALN